MLSLGIPLSFSRYSFVLSFLILALQVLTHIHLNIRIFAANISCMLFCSCPNYVPYSIVGQEIFLQHFSFKFVGTFLSHNTFDSSFRLIHLASILWPTSSLVPLFLCIIDPISWDTSHFGILHIRPSFNRHLLCFRAKVTIGYFASVRPLLKSLFFNVFLQLFNFLLTYLLLSFTRTISFTNSIYQGLHLEVILLIYS